MQTETQNLIEKWYELATGTNIGKVDFNDIYFQFMALWVSFNALYDLEYVRRYGPSGKGREFKGIKIFSEGKERKIYHESLLVGDDEYRRAVDCLDAKYGDKVKRLGCEDGLELALQCAREVRNSLFHARKLPGNLEDENLVRASYIVVSSVMLTEPYLR